MLKQIFPQRHFGNSDRDETDYAADCIRQLTIFLDMPEIHPIVQEPDHSCDQVL